MRSVRKSPPAMKSCADGQLPEKGSGKETDHGEVNVRVVLEGVEETNKPGRARGREDIALGKDMADLFTKPESARDRSRARGGTHLVHLQ